MAETRYYLPEITKYEELYTLEEIHDFFQTGELTAEDIATEEGDGLTHLVGDLVRQFEQEREEFGDDRLEYEILPAEAPRPIEREFRGDIPVKSPVSREVSIQAVPTPILTEFGVEPEESAQPSEPEEADLAEEYCLYDGHPSWWSYPRSMGFVILMLSASLLCLLSGLGFEWWLFLAGLAGVVATCISLHRITTTYVVTNRRVELEQGWIGSSTKEVRIQDIRAIDVKQSAWESILGIGSIHFDSSASSGPEVTFVQVRKPHAIKQAIRELQF